MTPKREHANMTSAEVLQVVSRLAQGIDPLTGEGLDQESCVRHPYVAQALRIAAQRLEHRTSSSAAPRWHAAKANGAWSPNEDAALLEEIAAGMPLGEIARRHGRRRGGILARAVWLGRFENLAEARTAMDNPRQRSFEWAEQDCDPASDAAPPF